MATLPENAMSERLHRQLDETLSYYASHPERIAPRLDELEREWSLERVLETEASLACLCGLAMGGVGRKRGWLAVSGIGAGYLLARALRGRPPASFLLRRLGFRSDREIDAEKRLQRKLLEAANGGPDAGVVRVQPLRVESNGSHVPPGARRIPVRTKGRKRWYKRAWFWVPAAILLVGIGLRLAITPILDRQMRGALQKMEGFSAGFSSVSLSLHNLTVVIHDFTMDRVPAADAQNPLLNVKTLQVGLSGWPLLRGRIVAEASFVEPHMHMVLAAAKSKTGAEPPPPPDPPDIGSALKKAMPVKIDRIEIRKGEMTVVDTGENTRPEIHMGEIEATIENIETGTQLGNGRPSVFALRGKIQESGELKIFYTADLLSKALTFAGQAELKGLKLAEINPIIAAKTEMKVERGEFDVFTAFSADQGKIAGGVKPLLKEVRMKAMNENLLTKLKAGLTDAALRLFSDRVPSREAVAALIPFEGEVTRPDTPILPTVMSVIRNAFVIGLASGFAHLPPAKELREGLTARESKGGAGPEATVKP